MSIPEHGQAGEPGETRNAPPGRRADQYVVWGSLLALLAACAAIILPFVTVLLWAVILTFSSWPLHGRLLRRVGGRRTLSAFLMSLMLGLAILTPFAIVGAKLASNVDGIHAAARGKLADGLPPPPGWLRKIPLVGGQAAERWQDLVSDRDRLEERVRALVEPASRSLLKLGAHLGSGLVHLALSVFMCFFLFRDGEAAAQRFTEVADRIGGERGRRLLLLAGETIRGVVYGILGTALVQAVIAWIGFKLAGIPGAGLLLLLSFFLAILPAGLVLVWLPAALWLFAQGSTGWGVFMVIWGIGVSSLDNFVRPWLISHGSKMPFLLVFLGVLGGMIAFGFIGVFLGPTLLSVAFRLVGEWSAATAPAETGRAGAPSVAVQTDRAKG
ncbi:MAG: AI-2E family transporter [Limisphaerales bacterium]